ncbi:galactose oxidase/kelch repeat superfamily protein [Striga asiatica]|uniref:Galactose oxidase/kelch repeat superfamily protein n=1 Tax=Striga asiatica TaxID=4170 RepID=A0A5A7Q8A3_STRAF|nr:galactose oxidase/kelch repeat superfamily protein [Striga asiatica]
MDIFFLPGRPSTSAHRRRRFAHNTQPPPDSLRRRVAPQRDSSSSSAAGSPPHLCQSARCLVSVHKHIFSTPSVTASQRPHPPPPPRHNSSVGRRPMEEDVSDLLCVRHESWWCVWDLHADEPVIFGEREVLSDGEEK